VAKEEPAQDLISLPPLQTGDRVLPEDLHVGDEVIYNHPVFGPQLARVVGLHRKAGSLTGFFPDRARTFSPKPVELQRIVKAWRSPESRRD
jgi:hypothetical protein